jgi:hypothetical protein
LNKEKRIKITITGHTPLIMNQFTNAAQITATEGNRVAAVGDRGTPAEQAESKIYRNEAGEPCIPQPNIFRCILDAGKFFKAGRSKVTTQKSSLIPACLDMGASTTFKLESSEGWSVDTRPVRIPATGGRILCHRPIFNDWSLSCEVVLDTEILSAKLLREIVDAAGKRIGLGDFRPDCKGPYGRFVVTRWEEVNGGDSDEE